MIELLQKRGVILGWTFAYGAARSIVPQFFERDVAGALAPNRLVTAGLIAGCIIGMVWSAGVRLNTWEVAEGGVGHQIDDWHEPPLLAARDR